MTDFKEGNLSFPTFKIWNSRCK